MMSEPLPNSELMMLASQIYVRLRRCNGRIIDAIYMVRSPEYAREILELAIRQPDGELLALAERYEKCLVAGLPQPASAKAADEPVAEGFGNLTMPVLPVLQLVGKTGDSLPKSLPDSPAGEPGHIPTEEEVAHHYIGALR